MTDMPFSTFGHPGSSHNDLGFPVFQQQWWLQLAKGDADYREMQVRHDGALVGYLPFVVAVNRLGNRLGFPPIWSHLGGPVVNQELEREERATVIRQLIAQLPSKMSFRFVCSSDGPDADLVREEFEKAGFCRLAETTYLQYRDDIGILERLSGESRRQIVSAQNSLEVVDLSAPEFVEFYAANLATAGKRSYASLQSAHNLIVKGTEADPLRVRVIGAKQKSKGAPLDAAIAYVWDQKRYYLWLVTHRISSGSSDPKPHPHAGKLLILVGTEDARRRDLIFDTDGGSSTGSRTLYRDRLKFPHAELRDVFIRDTRTYALYSRIRQNFLERSGSGNANPKLVQD